MFDLFHPFKEFIVYHILILFCILISKCDHVFKFSQHSHLDRSPN